MPPQTPEGDCKDMRNNLITLQYKNKLFQFDTKLFHKLSFTLNGEQLEIVHSYKYLGVTISNKRLTTLYKDHFALIKEKANKRLQCIKHFGFHKDGLRPETAIKLYKLLIRPILEYGAQVLVYNHFYLNSTVKKKGNLDIRTDFVKQLEQFQTKSLKTLLGCPKSASPGSPAIVRTFSGV